MAAISLRMNRENIKVCKARIGDFLKLLSVFSLTCQGYLLPGLSPVVGCLCIYLRAVVFDLRIFAKVSWRSKNGHSNLTIFTRLLFQFHNGKVVASVFYLVVHSTWCNVFMN